MSSRPIPDIPRRPLGRTGHAATILGLGGEGVLRTTGQTREAVAVIHRALDQGINLQQTTPKCSKKTFSFFRAQQWQEAVESDDRKPDR